MRSSKRVCLHLPKQLDRLAPSYHSSDVEKGWYRWWQESGRASIAFRSDCKGYFKPNKESRERYTMLLPPPNVTGNLHIGHALTCSIQDAMIRWRRMCGESVSWIPGTDHAGIATQTVVERKLLKENIRRQELGREKFVQEVWKWKDEYGDNITKQLRTMGSSLDWSQEYFTIDAQRSEAVTNAFVKLFDDGLIYRDTRLVNWCCSLQTAISDIEMDYEEIEAPKKLSLPNRERKVEFGVLHRFEYPIVDANGEYINKNIPIATTRVETMLGDVAVAIHPNDERFKSFHNLYVKNPLNSRILPIICDSELVDPSFGTGAVKITPGHDMNDYICGKRHGLPVQTIFSRNGFINENAGNDRFLNVDRFDARYAVIKELDNLGLYKGKSGHSMRLARCSRSGDIIEPMVQPQWYLKSKQLADRVLNDTEKGLYDVRPKHFQNQWTQWLSNMHDWCISRQLWWGHRIPAFRVSTSNNADDDFWVAAANEEEARLKASKKKHVSLTNLQVTQDDDVLDTWFSSALLPLSAVGYKFDGSKTPERYPQQAIETGSDILFFWVARMAMLCSYFTDAPPFKEILLHAMVRDSQGRKMSKSLGNVIDPIDVIRGVSLETMQDKLKASNLEKTEMEKSIKTAAKQFPKGIPRCGTDALRFTLIDYTQHIQKINLDVHRIVNNHHFCNKIWNLARFSLDRFKEHQFTYSSDINIGDFNPSNLFNRFILSKLATCVHVCNKAFENYELHEATTSLQKFVVNDLCDAFLEFSKSSLYQKDSYKSEQDVSETLTTLYICLDNAYRLIHPIMPFITEELWQHLQKFQNKSATESLMLATYPQTNIWCRFKNANVEENTDVILNTVSGIRSLKNAVGYKASVATRVYLQPLKKHSSETEIISAYRQDILKLSNSRSLEIINNEPSSDCWERKTVDNYWNIFIPANEHTSKSSKSAASLKKRLDFVMNSLSKLETEMKHENFVKNVPLKVQEIKKKQYDHYQQEKVEIEAEMKDL